MGKLKKIKKFAMRARNDATRTRSDVKRAEQAADRAEQAHRRVAALLGTDTSQVENERARFYTGPARRAATRATGEVVE
jgi:hypothetical protein